ncbi:DUF6221 family protein [Streptomyces sp. NPDC048272]|uniref:DUF6221 family protein n=1 Tax=Streptomyces sp. NPDC048272 TaxID=3154616 RepID=UPI00341A7784
MTEALINFIRDRLADDQRAAQLMEKFYPSPWELSDRGWLAHVVADGPTCREVIRLEQWQQEPDSEEESWLGDIIDHVVRHDPARVLADIESKRRILVLAERLPKLTASTDLFDNSRDAWGEVLKQLAVVYADHPGYREEWRP